MDMPSFDQAAEILKTLPVEHTHPNGRGFTSWKTLAFALFPKGSPAWIAPKGMPHGLDRSPAVVFMNDLQFSGKVKTTRHKNGHYFEVLP